MPPAAQNRTASADTPRANIVPATEPDWPPGFRSNRQGGPRGVTARLELRRIGGAELELSAFNDGRAPQHFRVPSDEDGSEPHYDWRVFQRDAEGRWRLLFRDPTDPPDVPANWAWSSPGDTFTLQPGERRPLPLHLPAGTYPIDRSRPVVLRVAVGWRARVDETGELAMVAGMAEAAPLVLPADEWLRASAGR